MEVFQDGTRNLSFKFYSTKQIGMCSGTSKEEQEFFIILYSLFEQLHIVATLTASLCIFTKSLCNLYLIHNQMPNDLNMSSADSNDSTCPLRMSSLERA